MRFIQIFVLIFCFLFISSDMLASVVDSVGVENQNGKKCILHKVETKETYYSIARRYRVSPRSISDFSKQNVLKEGALVKVSTEIPFTEEINALLLMDYVIQPQETLYSLARKTEMTVQEIKDINHLKSNDLAVGQVLKVKSSLKVEPKKITENYVSLSSEEDEKEEDSDLKDNNASAGPSHRLKLSLAKYGLRETVERGIGVCLSDENLDGTQMLALHRTAPIGTVIKITNPMNQKSTFAKVVGKFTENESTKDAIIVLTKAVADLIGVLDKKFQVNLMYGIPNG